MTTSPSRPVSAVARRLTTLLVSSAVALGLGACAKPAVGTEREGDVIVRQANTAGDKRLTPQQIDQQKKLRQQAAKRRVEIQRAGWVKEEEQKCTNDDECTLVAMHCCSCDYKGQLVGINRVHIPQLAVRRTGVCQTYTCVAQKSDAPSCQAKEAVCKAGMCVPDLSGVTAPPAGIGVEPIEEDPAPDETPQKDVKPAEGAGAP
jgi:hypothetical protein